MRAIIVDDNVKARIALKSDLQDYCPEIEVVGEAEGIETAFIVTQEYKPDLIFLDIRMGDGTGFDFLEKFKPMDSINFKVIFTTAYDEFALEAFKYAAVDYLLKPIDSDSLMTAVQRALQFSKKDENQKIEELINHITKPKITKLSLSEAGKIHLIATEDVIRCESYKNYTTFFLLSGEKITVSKTIKEYDTMLNNNNFLRVHHSHLVNLDKIKEVIKIDGPYLKMVDGSSVPVSSRKKDDLYQRIKEMW